MSNEFDVSGYRLEDGSGNIVLEDGSGKYLLELQGYPGLVIADGPRNYWRFGEASNASPAADVLGANNGTYVGSPTVSAAGALDGDANTAVTLNGTTQYVTATGGTAYTPSASMTIECWFRPTSAKLANLMTTTVVADTQELFYDTSASNVVAVSFSQSGLLGGTLAVQKDYTIGEWLYYAVTFDYSTTTARAYLNGQNANEDIGGTPTIVWSGTAAAWDGSSGLFLGTNSDGTGSFHAGDLDEFAIYPAALTAEQIARHYRCGLQFLPDIPPPVRIAAH